MSLDSGTGRDVITVDANIVAPGLTGVFVGTLPSQSSSSAAVMPPQEPEAAADTSASEQIAARAPLFRESAASYGPAYDTSSDDNHVAGSAIDRLLLGQSERDRSRSRDDASSEPSVILTCICSTCDDNGRWC